MKLLPDHVFHDLKALYKEEPIKNRNDAILRALNYQKIGDDGNPYWPMQDTCTWLIMNTQSRTPHNKQEFDFKDVLNAVLIREKDETNARN